MNSRDLIAIGRPIRGTVSDTVDPRTKAYNTLLSALQQVLTERNRFDAEAARERWRRARAERALRYAHCWCGGLMAAVVVLGMAVILLAVQS